MSIHFGRMSKAYAALAVMVEIARKPCLGPITVAAVAEATGISASYVEVLGAKMRRAGLLRSARGPGGGFFLAQRPSDISALSIVLALEQTEFAPPHWIGTAKCLLGEIGVLEGAFLQGISLADLAWRIDAQEAAQRRSASAA